MKTKVEKPKKDLHYKLRMTAETKAEILEKRKIYGVSSTAKFLTELLTTLTVNPVDKEQKRVNIGIGTNLNQIAKLANQGVKIPQDLMDTLEKLRKQLL